MVTSGFLAGAEMMTFCAPASRCFAAAARSVKCPVDSMTTSAPSSFHGSTAGSVSAVTRTLRPSMTSASSWISTTPGKTPCTESYLNRWPSVLASVRSLMPTNSMSAPCLSAARTTSRPMRPKPLMPTRTLISTSRWVPAPAYRHTAAAKPPDDLAAVTSSLSAKRPSRAARASGCGPGRCCRCARRSTASRRRAARARRGAPCPRARSPPGRRSRRPPSCRAAWP